jgi:predicted nucleotidyltransferase
VTLIKEAIHKNDPNALAYLFGSRARYDFRPDSDWDILIQVKEFLDEIKRNINEINALSYF